ncbi:MAG TPA: hypothetical protein VJ890_16890 [Vineibacter sp.]|nr:hypothetical protein [Vineibacter sp.]
MPRTPARSRTNITQASLERLGAPRLAEILAEQSRLDAGLRETLTRALAQAASPPDYARYIERRVRALAKAARVGDATGTNARLRELDQLRGGAVGAVAAHDRMAALDLLRQMAELSPTIAKTFVPVSKQVEDWQAAVLGSLAQLCQAAGPDGLEVTVDAVATCCARYTSTPRVVVGHFTIALGDSGLERLRDRLQADLASLPAEVAGGRWGVAGDRHFDSGNQAWFLRLRLGEIADLRGDVDGFIALQLAQPRKQVDVRAIVERLLRAGRGAEALAWLDDARYQNRLIDTASERLAALEAAGRASEAQALRWQRFERQLDRAALKAHLERLPDFEDFEAERRAMTLVLGHKSATEALAFLLAWPNLDAAAQLIEGRWHEFGPTPPESLLSAAEALHSRHPRAAVLAARLAVDGVLRRGLQRLFERAARILADYASLEPPLEPNHESNAAFVEQLRQTFPRQWEFWRVYDGLAR